MSIGQEKNVENEKLDDDRIQNKSRNIVFIKHLFEIKIIYNNYRMTNVLLII